MEKRRHQQVWSAETYARNGAFVPAFGVAVVALLDPQPGERILDLGCGDGTLTLEIAASGATVTGVDASEEFVNAARAKGIDARLADGRDLAFDREFDAAFSNAALHWMREPDRVIASVARALVPGGRFVAEMGGEGNVAGIFAAVHASLARRGIDASDRFPWYFPSAAEYSDRLRAGGFEVETIELFARPTVLPGEMHDWLATFAQPFFAGLADGVRAEIVNEVTEALAPVMRDERGIWTADYVRLRFRARNI